MNHLHSCGQDSRQGQEEHESGLHQAAPRETSLSFVLAMLQQVSNLKHNSLESYAWDLTITGASWSMQAQKILPMPGAVADNCMKLPCQLLLVGKGATLTG